jgi:hypothetical protein
MRTRPPTGLRISPMTFSAARCLGAKSRWGVKATAPTVCDETFERSYASLEIGVTAVGVLV